MRALKSIGWAVLLMLSLVLFSVIMAFAQPYLASVPISVRVSLVCVFFTGLFAYVIHTCTE